jgi:hypothetical protein
MVRCDLIEAVETDIRLEGQCDKEQSKDTRWLDDPAADNLL